MESPFAPGERVTARAQRWQVGTSRLGRSCVAITLSPLDDAAPGPRTLIHPFDRFTRHRRHGRLRTARLAHALAELSAIERSPRLRWFVPHTLAGTDIDILPHQLIASLALVRGLASRVCVMDAVGTGKTIQAGIAIAELLARGLAARVLVIVPAQLRQQWASELARLDVSARVLDAHGRDEAGRALPVDVSPWGLPGTTIASVDLIKRRDTLAGLEGLPWDLVVVDEAHGAASHTERHDAVDALARRAQHVILLSATPHDGDDLRHRRLISLGGTDAVLVVRRRAPRLARRVHHLAIAPSPDEVTAFAMLDRYRSAMNRCTGTARLATNRLVAEVLARRAAASMFALARTAGRRRDTLGAAEQAQPLLFATSIDILDTHGDDDEAIDAFLAAPGALDVRHERALLGSLLSAALRAARHDTLVHAIGRIVRRAREPVIVFAEHRDALVPLMSTLSRVAIVDALHGGCSAAERDHALSSFTARQTQVLLATDTAAEGLNLHQRCRFVVHLDTPWTISRLAQREGRVDRHGQSRPVHAWRLSRQGFEPVALRARQRDRARIVDDALAQYGDVPVLVQSGQAQALPDLADDAQAAARASRAARAAREGRGARCHAARQPPAPIGHVRSRLVAIDRHALTGLLHGANALLLLSVAVVVSPLVVETRHLVVRLSGGSPVEVTHPLHRRWKRRLADIRPALDAFAAEATRATADDLMRDEQQRRATLDARLRHIDEALRTPLAAHFVPRTLFDPAPDGWGLPLDPVPLRHPWAPLSSHTVVDVPLVLVAVDRPPHYVGTTRNR